MLKIDHFFSMLNDDLNFLIVASLNFHYFLTCSSDIVSKMFQIFDYIEMLHTNERKNRHNFQCKELKIRFCEKIIFTYISTFTKDCFSIFSAKLFILSEIHLCQFIFIKLIHFRKFLS